MADSLNMDVIEASLNGKKRRCTPQKWKRNDSKRAKSIGEAHKTYKGDDVPARVQIAVTCRCNCSDKLTADEKHFIFQAFNEMEDHEKQNIYLRGCIRVKGDNVIRRRPRNPEPSTQRMSFIFSVTINGNSINLCKAAFCGMHGIKESRLKKKVLNFNNHSMTDMRGRHVNHKALEPDLRERIRTHIRSLQPRESHYSRAKNMTRLYLDSNLCVSDLFRMFMEENPELKDSIKDWVYRDIFNYEFNLSFGYPRSDLCDKCELLHVQIKSSERQKNEAEVAKLKAEHALHVRQGDAFYEHLKRVTAEANDDPELQVICLDFQKNFALPVTNIGQEYYKRQLAIHNFCIHNVSTSSAVMHIYPEHFAKKGPNEVISCLQDYLLEHSAGVKKLVMFLDNCFSQNKNKFLFAFLQHVVNTQLIEITLYYPIPGHSWMPCDRDFGRIEKKKTRNDKFLKPSDLTKLIASADASGKFQIKFVEKPFTDTLSDDNTPVIKVKDYKSALNPILKDPGEITKIRTILFKRGLKPMSRSTMNGPFLRDSVEILKRGRSLKCLDAVIASANPAYEQILPIKSAKLKDIQSLLSYVDSPVEFYSSLTDVGVSDDHETDQIE